MLRLLVIPLALVAQKACADTNAITITTPADGTSFKQKDDIQMTWEATNPDGADPANPEYVRIYKCAAPSTTLSCSLNTASCEQPYGHRTLNDLQTTLMASDYDWTTPAGAFYLCMQLGEQTTTSHLTVLKLSPTISV